MRTAIYGAGSTGTILGAFLAKAGEEIDLISRNESHVNGLKKKGAHIVGTVDFVQPVRAFLPGEMTGKYDIIFLTTKQIDNAGVVKGLLPFLNADGAICTMQNGLPEWSVAEVAGPERTYGCAIAWGATMIGEGVCELTSEPTREALTFSLGSLDGHRDDKYAEISRLLNLMGNVIEESNFIGARWVKLLVNSAFSGLSAVLGCTFGEVAADKRSRRIAQKIIKECIDVAHAVNIKIEPIQGKDVVKLLDYHSSFKQKISFLIIPLAIRKHRLLKASMLQDLEKGKKCEIDAINGMVCTYGKKAGVPTPFDDRVVEIIRDIENRKGKPGWENLSRFDDL
jgi:2-dehydropantoate 2-reductase